jgi:YesN/AraC family two-component response regulator
MRQDMHSVSMKVDSLLSADPSLTLQQLAHAIGIDRHYIESAVREHHGFSFCELKKRGLLQR